MLVTAVVFALIARYYDADPARSPFVPSVRLGTGGVVNQASQQATLFGLLSGHPEMSPTGTTHVAYIGLPALILAGLALRRRSVGLPVAALVALGVVTALGEHLVVDDGFATIGGAMIALPGRLLALTGYPLAQSGQYYRAILLAWAGVTLAIALAPLGRYRALAFGLLVADGFRLTAPILPFPARPVEGRAAWAAIAADPAPGAVLDLPLSVGNLNLGEAMLAAALHGRAVQVIPVFMPLRDTELFKKNLAWVETALPRMSGPIARERLRDAGFAYVVWRPVAREGGPTLPDLERMLGTPQVDGEVRWWKVE